MGRSPCCSKEGMNRGAWTALEDKILTDYIKAHGEGRWRNLPQKSGLKRCGKSCRLRWLNYLRPDIKRGNISPDEEDLIIRLHKLLGNRWSLIAGRLPGRTDNEIKNYWNTNLVKKVQDHHHHQNSASDHSNHNHHSTDKTKKKPMIIEPPPPNIKPPPLVHHSKPITNVIISPVPEKVDHVPMLRDNSSVDDLVHYGSSYNNGLSSFDGGEEDAVPENFKVDLTTMGDDDVHLSDLLNSEFSDFWDFNCIKSDINVYDHNNYPSSSSRSPSPSPWPQPPPSPDLVFSNEILEDWALCDQNVASNLNSISSFLDTEEGDWLYI